MFNGFLKKNKKAADIRVEAEGFFDPLDMTSKNSKTDALSSHESDFAVNNSGNSQNNYFFNNQNDVDNFDKNKNHTPVKSGVSKVSMLQESADSALSAKNYYKQSNDENKGLDTLNINLQNINSNSIDYDKSSSLNKVDKIPLTNNLDKKNSTHAQGSFVAMENAALPAGDRSSHGFVGDANWTDFGNSESIIKTMPKNNTVKAETITMADAIKMKAGEKELKKWQNNLGTPAVNIENAYTPSERVSSENKGNISDLNIESAQAEDKKEEKRIYKGTIRTFKMDVQDLMRKDKLSLAKIVAIESDRRRMEQHAKKVQKEKQTISFAMLLLIFAVFTTILIFVFAFYTNMKMQTLNNDYVAKNQTETSLLGGIIFVEDRLSIDITDKPNFYILQVIRAAVYSKQIIDIIGNITEIALFEKTKTGEYRRIQMEELLNIIYPKAPDLFKEIVSGQNYMLGVHVTADGKRNAFLVFNIKSYAYAISEMLKWEKSIMKTLGPIMVHKYKRGQSDDRFQDAVLKNYNVRVVKYPNGKIKFLYGFVGQNSIIITSNPKTFLEVVKRLKIEQGL